MNLKELTAEYYNETFNFKNLYKTSVVYEKILKNKTVTVKGYLDSRSNLLYRRSI